MLVYCLYCCCSSISSIVFDTQCVIGFHSTFLNRATKEIGIYVSINNGKVKRDQIFFFGEAIIFFHSVIKVIAATENISKQKLAIANTADSKVIGINCLNKSGFAAANIKKIIFNTNSPKESSVAGAIVINIS